MFDWSTASHRYRYLPTQPPPASFLHIPRKDSVSGYSAGRGDSPSSEFIVSHNGTVFLPFRRPAAFVKIFFMRPSADIAGDEELAGIKAGTSLTRLSKSQSPNEPLETILQGRPSVGTIAEPLEGADISDAPSQLQLGRRCVDRFLAS
jgi:hypothetical protein